MSGGKRGTVGERRDVKRGERSDHLELEVRESGSMTFGPGVLLYLVPVAACIAGWAALYGLLHSPPMHITPVKGLLGFAAAVVLLVTPFKIWARFRVDAEGVERVTLSGRRRWDWARIGGVRAKGIESRTGHAVNAKRWVVYDLDGRELFRISVWTRRGRELAKEIRRRSSEAHPS